jgi:hypothetical protein
MILDRVTITGADDSVDPKQLYNISMSYPFVEWGILLYPEKFGKPRYPSKEWINNFIENKPPWVMSALHICGDKNINEFSWHPTDPLYMPFNRIQLNTFFDCCNLLQIHTITTSIIHLKDIHDIIIQHNEKNHEYIQYLQNKYKNKIKYSVLFDSSRGNGIEIDHIKQPISNLPCGYAGGISPSNVANVLTKLDILPCSYRTWIDIESGIRENNEFNLSKVLDVLNQCRYDILGEIQND